MTLAEVDEKINELDALICKFRDAQEDLEKEIRELQNYKQGLYNE